MSKRTGLTILLLGVAVAASPAHAGASPSPPFCQSAAAKLKGDGDLAQAVRTAFGAPTFTNEEKCVYPLQTLRYADVDVLVTENLDPQQANHGSEGDLSAVALKRIPGGFKRLRSFEAFGQTGSFGAVASIAPIAIGGDDGIAIEAGDRWQGYTVVTLELYAFRRQGLVRLDSDAAQLYLMSDNEGAETDAAKVVTIDSAWSLSAGELTIDYRVSDARGKRQSRAVWTVGETQLTLKSGAIPSEMTRAVGSE
ncbi:MAG: hypothetical protein JO107_11800 [Hyphomicrobiales bacterium]|nr:hypothetical protein [Hyphomicrobiales bacterium]